MSRRNDQVFQVSLTEIAFILIFILLLLLGYLVFKAQAEKERLEGELTSMQSTKESAEALEAAKKELAKLLQGAGAGAVSLDEAITRLTEAQKLREERDRLKTRIEDLESKLTALMEVHKILQGSAPEAKKDAVMAEVTSALALQEALRKELEPATSGKGDKGSTGDKPGTASRASSNQNLLEKVQGAIKTAQLLKSSLEKQLGKSLIPGEEAKTIEAVVAAAHSQAEQAKSGGDLNGARKENADLRGQVAFFKRRLEARGGRDYPPCWASEAGSPEYLFSVELMPTGVVVKPSWPAHRENDAKALPGIEAALQSPVLLETFVKNVQGIFAASKAADPQCRHYVYLRSTISEATASDRARLTVENYFYKNELRR